MVVTAAGLVLMTTLGEGTSYWWPGIFQFIVGVGSGMFNSPNTAAMMGVVAAHRRGIASGARVLVQNTGAVLSIAFVMAVVTSGINRNVLFNIFSGLGKRITTSQMAPFLSNMHLALWCMTGFSIIGAVVSFARPKHVANQSEEVAAPAAEPAPTEVAAA
jgi:MFS family permease